MGQILPPFALIVKIDRYSKRFFHEPHNTKLAIRGRVGAKHTHVLMMKVVGLLSFLACGFIF